MENARMGFEIYELAEEGYVRSRRLEGSVEGRYCHLTIKTEDLPAVNEATACSLEELRALKEGKSLKLADAKGFPLRLIVEGEFLVVDYQGDIQSDPRFRFCGHFMFRDFQALVRELGTPLSA